MQPRDSDHVVDVGRDERRIERECMCRDSGIEVLNPRATAFQSRLDAAERLADGIGPLGSWSSAEMRSKRDCSAARRFDRGRRSMPNAISASTGCGTATSAGAVAASRSTTAAVPFMSADTALVSRT
jgi:hypothetical protein